MTSRGLSTFLVATILILSTTVGCTRAHRSGAQHLPRNSFLFITNQFLVRACAQDPEHEPRCLNVDMGMVTGSGFLIATKGERSYGITAGHLCIQGPPEGTTHTANGVVYRPEVSMAVQVFGIGNADPVRASVMRVDPTLDLCLLEINRPAQQVIELSPEPPRPGDKVYNMAAPLGTFDPNEMLLTFDGYYSGSSFMAAPLASYGGMPSRFDAYTIPSRPGSSGSPIMNDAGQLIGVTSMALTRFESMCLSPHYEGVASFVRSAFEEIYGGGRQ